MDAYTKVVNHGYLSRYSSNGKIVLEDGSVITNSSEPTRFYNAVDSLNGFRNPRWKDQIRLGQNATTPLTGSRTSPDPQTFFTAGLTQTLFNTQTQQSRVSNYEAYGKFLPLGPPTPSVPNSGATTRVDNHCIRKFLDAAAAIQSSIEAGQDFGELKQTIESIHHPLKSLREGILHYLQALKRIKVSKRYKRPHLEKVIGDVYLEWHFGWNPLVADIADLIADAGRTRFPVYPVYASAGETFDGVADRLQLSLGVLPGVAYMPYRTTHRYSVRMKGAIRSNASSSTGTISWAQSLRLTPKDWLPTIWDLVPYSWMADYFINIGDILQALSFVESSLVWGSRTSRTFSETETFGLTYAAPNDVIPFPYRLTDNTAWCYGGSYKTSVSSVNRSTIGEGDLIPRVEVSIPTSKYPFFNMAAVLSQSARSSVKALKANNPSFYT